MRSVLEINLSDYEEPDDFDSFGSAPAQKPMPVRTDINLSDYEEPDDFDSFGSSPPKPITQPPRPVPAPVVQNRPQPRPFSRRSL
jgi:hypothetical protein